MSFAAPRGRRLVSLALACSLGLAAASPASDLYRSATTQAEREYYGWATADLGALSRKYEAELDSRCAPAGDACDYATGRAVLADWLREFGDPHMSVRDPEAAQRLQEITQNLAVPRLGLRAARAEGGLLVTAVMPGSPAALAGVRLYDLLPTVGGQDAGKRAGKDAPVGPNDLTRLERAGGEISLTLRRAGEAEQTLALTPAVLQARDVPGLRWAGEDGRVAVIDFPSFLPDDAAPQFLARVREAQAGGARALVVDLRYNGGGTLTQCVAAASIFAPVTYQLEYRGGRAVYRGVDGQEGRGRSPQGGAVWRGPAAVLVGPGTASCAEVFSVYAQRAGAVVVGEPTRGVGNSGVTFAPLPDGGVMTITVLRAFGPDGQALPAKVTPDVTAPFDVPAYVQTGRDATLDAAVGALAGRLAPAAVAR